MTFRFITIPSEDIMTVAKDLCCWCSFGYEQPVQACMCVWSMSVHTSGCSLACRQRGRSSAKTHRLAQCTFKCEVCNIFLCYSTVKKLHTASSTCVFQWPVEP